MNLTAKLKSLTELKNVMQACKSWGILFPFISLSVMSPLKHSLHFQQIFRIVLIGNLLCCTSSGPFTSWNYGAFFKDESRFIVSTIDRCERIWRCSGGHQTACDINHFERVGSGSLMIWSNEILRDCQTLFLCSWSYFPPIAGHCLASFGQSELAFRGW